jgi:tRNA threonylcarbamoyladenosine biosynthesis protein TsaE
MLANRENGTFLSHSENHTLALGIALAKLLKNGDVISLKGPLGAGKTCFIKGLAMGLGIDADQVNSPSYTIVNEYHGEKDLYHFDLYRLEGEADLNNIGWDDYLTRDGIIAVEWGEKAGQLLPKKHIEVEIEMLYKDSRRLTMQFWDF